METETNSLLKRLAAKYIWWKTADEALRTPKRIIAQVMDIGDFDDVQQLAERVGDDTLRKVISHAEAGQFNDRSWHYRLGLSKMGKVPPMPTRKVA